MLDEPLPPIANVPEAVYKMCRASDLEALTGSGWRLVRVIQEQQVACSAADMHQNALPPEYHGVRHTHYTHTHDDDGRPTPSFPPVVYTTTMYLLVQPQDITSQLHGQLSHAEFAIKTLTERAEKADATIRDLARANAKLQEDAVTVAAIQTERNTLLHQIREMRERARETSRDILIDHLRALIEDESAPTCTCASAASPCSWCQAKATLAAVALGLAPPNKKTA